MTMNNGTKQAYIMTWSNYKKKFKPTIIGASDSTFGTISTIKPTMRNIGFNSKTLWDVDESKKPIEIVKENIDIFINTYIIYYKFRYRDGSGIGIDVFFK